MPTPEEIAEFAVELSRDKPHVRRVIEDVKLFDGLTEQVGWKRLAEIVKGERERFFASIASRIASGKVVDQREIDYKRGFYEGARWIIDTPEQAEASLEAAAREAWRLTQLEMAREAEEASPYIDPTGGE